MTTLELGLTSRQSIGRGGAEDNKKAVLRFLCGELIKRSADPWELIEQEKNRFSLLAAAAGPDLRFGKDLASPLHFACQLGRYDFVEALLAGDAHPDLPNRKGLRPLELAILSAADAHHMGMSDKRDYLEITALSLLNHGANPNGALEEKPLYLASSGGLMVTTSALLKAGAERLEGTPFSPMHAAASAGDANMITMLVTEGYDVNERMPDTLQTPLHAAANSGNFQACKVLLMNGADPENRNARKETPMHVAMGSARNAFVSLRTNIEIQAIGRVRAPLRRAR